MRYINKIFRLCQKINKYPKPKVSFDYYGKFCSVTIWLNGSEDIGNEKCESLLLDGKYSCFFLDREDDMRSLYDQLKAIYSNAREAANEAIRDQRSHRKPY